MSSERSGAQDTPGGARHAEEEPAGAASSPESLGDLVGRLTTDASALVRQELELAKAEAKEEARRAGKASGMLVAGGVVGFVALLLVSWALAWLVSLAVPTWVAFLIVGVVYAVVAAALIAAGRKKLQQVSPKPEQTVESLKENKEWVSNQP